MIRIYLCDDHSIVRDGIARILGEQADMTVVGTAVDGEDALADLLEVAVDVLVLDLTLPRMTGAEVLRWVVENQPHVRVVILSTHAEDQFAVHLLRTGAAGYLTKGSSSSELLAAVRTVAAGGRHVGDKALEQLLSSPRPGTKAPHEVLSDREREVFDLLALGETPSTVAVRLELSASTVSTYVARIKQKLGVGSLGGIVTYAHRHGLA